jgi:CheY-like chemotaxis protein
MAPGARPGQGDRAALLDLPDLDQAARARAVHSEQASRRGEHELRCNTACAPSWTTCMSTVGNADPALVEPSSQAEFERPRLPAPATPARVLCVDDEPAILAMLERALGGRFQVVTATDPVHALALLERERFAVVISDLLMPGLPGLAFLERVKTLAPACTRVGLTGCLDLQLPSDIAFGILTKPCALPLLEATVAAAVQFHALRATEPTAALPSGVAPPDTSPGSSVTESGLRPIRGGARPSSAPAQWAAPSIPAARARRLAVSVLGTSVELWPRATLLGRAMDNDIVVCDPRIAPRHLRFFRSWRGVTVQDLSGTRSVRLNGARLGGVRFIQPGDCVGLGPFDVYVHALDEA